MKDGILENKILKKVELAKTIIKKCRTKSGFQASVGLYGGSFWTRDLFYSIDSVLDLGYGPTVKKHIQEVLERQKATGEVPTFYVSLVSRGFAKGMLVYLWQLIKGKRKFKSDLEYTARWHRFMADNEYSLVMVMHHYVKKTKDTAFLNNNRGKIRKSVDFVNSSLEDFMIRGIGFHDAMKNYENKFCILSQVLLYHFYQCIGNKEYARNVKKKINTVFWNDRLGYYVDYIGSDHFDTLAHALAIIYGVVPKDRINKVVKAFSIASSKYGYKNITPTYPQGECGYAPYFYQNSTIWPFVHGFAILALIKTGNIKLAKEEFIKFTNQIGCNEWYDARTGKPMGSSGQLWSAALYLQVYENFKKYL